MTRAQRAEAIERMVEAISNIERGRSLPPLALLKRIAGLTGCSLVTLVEEPAGEGKVSERAGLETRLATIGKSLPIEQLRISVGQIAALQAEEGRGSAPCRQPP